MYSIVRFYTLKNTKTRSAIANARAQVAHDFRLIDVDFTDAEKYEDNEVLYVNENLLTTEEGKKFIPFCLETKNQKPQINFKEIFNDHIKKYCKPDFRIKSNAIHALEIMMSASSKRPDDFDEKGWIADSMKWCEDKFGKDNIVFAVVHRDETAPHIHVQIIPTYDGVLNASKFIGKMEKNRDLNRSYYEAVKKYGFEKRKHPLFKRHVSIGEFRRRLAQAMEEPVPAPKAGENLVDYYKRIQEWAEMHNAQEYMELQRKRDEAQEAMVEARIERKVLDEQSLKIDAHKRDFEDMEALRHMLRKDDMNALVRAQIEELIREGHKEIAEPKESKSIEKDTNEARQ